MYRVSWHLNRFHGIQINEAAKKEKLSYVFSSKEERTTDTEDMAIAADAIQGLRERPHGTKMPKIRTHKIQCTCIFYFSTRCIIERTVDLKIVQYARSLVQGLTSSNRDSDQIVDGGSKEVDADSAYSLLRELNSCSHI